LAEFREGSRLTKNLCFVGGRDVAERVVVNFPEFLSGVN